MKKMKEINLFFVATKLLWLCEWILCFYGASRAKKIMIYKHWLHVKSGRKKKEKRIRFAIIKSCEKQRRLAARAHRCLQQMSMLMPMQRIRKINKRAALFPKTKLLQDFLKTPFRSRRFLYSTMRTQIWQHCIINFSSLSFHSSREQQHWMQKVPITDEKEHEKVFPQRGMINWLKTFTNCNKSRTEATIDDVLMLMLVEH